MNGWYVWLGLMFAGCTVSNSLNHAARSISGSLDDVARSINRNHATCVCGKGPP